MCGLSTAYYSRAELPPIVPNLETLTIYSICEMASIPIVPSRFCHLKYLNIRVPRVARHQAYDYFSLACFLMLLPPWSIFPCAYMYWSAVWSMACFLGIPHICAGCRNTTMTSSRV